MIQNLLLPSLLLLVALMSTTKGIELISRSNLSRALYWKLGCPGSGPFTTISDCYIICDDNSCTNAEQVCSKGQLSCDALIRSPKGLDLPLKGQLVELVSLNLSRYKNEVSQHRNSCLSYGKRLSHTALAIDLLKYKKMYRRPIDQFINGKGTILFFHLRKAGGSTMCSLARNYGIVTAKDFIPRKKQTNESVKKSKFHRMLLYGKEFSLLYGREFYDKNCNPAFSDRYSAWYGNKSQQIKWSEKNKIQFYGSEIMAPVMNEIPFGTFVVGSQFRHPIKRLYSLYKENMYILCSKMSSSKCSILTSKMNVSIQGPQVSRKYYEHIAELETPSSNKNTLHRILLDSSSLKSRSQYKSSSSKSSSNFNKAKFIGQTKIGQLEILNQTEANLSKRLQRHVPKIFKEKWKFRHLYWITYLNSVRQNQDIAFFSSKLICEEKKIKADDCIMDKYLTEKHAVNTIEILKRLSFLSILEGVNWMLLDILRNTLKFNISDIETHRKGTFYSDTVNIFDEMAHDSHLINTALSAANMDINVYAHATAIACINYFHEN